MKISRYFETYLVKKEELATFLHYYIIEISLYDKLDQVILVTAQGSATYYKPLARKGTLTV